MAPALNPRQLVKQSGLTLLQQLVGALCSLASTILIARRLGPVLQGKYNVATTTAWLVGLCTNLGTPAATVYAVSRGWVDPQRAGRYSGQIALCLGGLGAAIIVGAAGYAPQALWPGMSPHLLYAAAALVPLLLWAQLLGSVLQGAQAFARYNVMTLLAPVTALIGCAIALMAGASAGSCLGALCVGHLTAAIWGARQVRHLAPQAKVSASPAGPHVAPPECTSQTAVPAGGDGAWPYLRGLMGFGLLAALANALAMATYRIDVLFLNAWAPGEAVGHYNLAASVAERLWMLSQAINMVLFAHVARQPLSQPQHAKRAESSDTPSLNPTPILVRHVLWLVAAAATVLFAAAPWLIPQVFGAGYAGAVAPLRALLPGVVCFNVARIVGQDLAGRGRVHLNVGVGALGLVLNVGLNALWIPPYGAVGAAWASSISYSVDSLIKLRLYGSVTGTPWRQVIFLQPEDWLRLRHWCRR